MRVAVYAGDARHALARVARTLRRPTGQSATIQLSAGAARRIALAGRVRLEFRSREALRPEAMTVRVARG
jgi:hypothetical protein